jgi:hypothetical protein
MKIAPTVASIVGWRAALVAAAAAEVVDIVAFRGGVKERQGWRRTSPT